MCGALTHIHMICTLSELRTNELPPRVVVRRKVQGLALTTGQRAPVHHRFFSSVNEFRSSHLRGAEGMQLKDQDFPVVYAWQPLRGGGGRG